MIRSRKRLGLVFTVVAAPLAIASVAYACANLATLQLDASKGRPGKVVTGKGHNYSTDPTASLVQLRWKSRTGKLLWEGIVNPDRTITPSFAVPKAKAGWYTVLATQYKADGAPVAGAPGRAAFKVRKPRSSAAVPVIPGSDRSGGGREPVTAPFERAPVTDSPVGVPMIIALSVALMGGALVTLRRKAPALITA